MPSKDILANREANSRHNYDVTIWLSRTTDNSNIFIRSCEVRDNESQLYIDIFAEKMWVAHFFQRKISMYMPYYKMEILTSHSLTTY